MTRLTLSFAALLLVFGNWLSIRRWKILTPFDLVIVVIQSTAPFLRMSLLVVKLTGGRYSMSQMTLRIGSLQCVVFQYGF